MGVGFTRSQSVHVMSAVKKSAAYGKWSIGELMAAGTCNNICFGNWAGEYVLS